jgi:hypothetical protein
MSEEAVSSVKADQDTLAKETDDGSIVDKRRPENRSYPRKPLSEALKVVSAIKENNAGKPWSPAQIADAIGRKQRSSDFQYIIAAARQFNLIEGAFRSEAIALSELGRSIAYCESDTQEKGLLFKAFTSVPVFKLVYEYYEGNPIPERKYLTNTLIERFKINKEYVDEFVNLFEGNCRFVGIDLKEEVRFIVGLEQGTEQRATAPSSPLVRSGRNSAFVIMPFVERGQQRSTGFFKEVFNSLIKPAAQSAGFEVETANQAGSDVIQSTIINKILDAEIVIADLTDHNPNVMFELGMRVADNKGPICLIKASDTGRLFDVDNMMRVYEYNPSLWSSTIQIDIPNLEGHIRAAWDNRNNNMSYVDILRRRA